jgi:hypothetical protein
MRLVLINFTFLFSLSSTTKKEKHKEEPTARKNRDLNGERVEVRTNEKQNKQTKQTK